LVFLRWSTRCIFTVTLSLLLAPWATQSHAQQPDSDETSPPEVLDQPEADKLPLVVGTRPAPTTDTGAAEDKQQAADRRLTQLLSVGTVLLLALQVALIGWQIRISNKQNRLFDSQNEIMEAQSAILNGQLVSTEKAAQAAHTSADTARDALALAASTFIELCFR
jgi:hypothetical protein